MLFLDELPEFQPNVLDALRQPLETGEIDRRARQSSHPVSGPHPAHRRHEPVQVRRRARHDAAGAARAVRPNTRPASPAPCSTGSTCRSKCQPSQPPTSFCRPALEGSREVRARVTAARDRQRARLAARGVKGVRTNAELTGQLLDEITAPDPEGLALLRKAAETMKLSARGFHRVLRVARTLADLDASDGVGRLHIAEALSYRGEALRDRQAA